jgi:RimJ/RimL family protein N-acetyltransferase
MMGNSLLPLVGSAVTVRAAVTGDLEAWYRLESDADVKRYLNGPITHSRDEWISGMRGHIEGGSLLTWVVAVNTTGAFTGRVRLGQYDLSSDWEIQVVIDKAHWGKGFGKEASELLIRAGLELSPTAGIVAVIHPQNEASQRLVFILGFQLIGQKTTDGWDNGHQICRLAPEDFALSAG